MATRTQQIKEAGQSLWLDNIQRRELSDGTLQRMIDEDGICGITSNPTIFMNAVSGSSDYDDQILPLVKQGKIIEQIYRDITVDDIRDAGKTLFSVFDSTGHADGFVSIELNPQHAFNVDESIAEARQLIQAIGLPNIMIKVPGTPEGIRVANSLLCEGINVNITLLFDPACYRLVAQTYIEALEDRSSRGEDLCEVHSVASFFISRLDTQVDKRLDAIAAARPDQAEQAATLRGRAAESIARVTFGICQELFESERFKKLADKGARPQRLLWASTGTKDPAYSDVKYVEGLLAPGTVNTLPPKTLAAFRDHGKTGPGIQEGFDEAPDVLQNIAAIGIDLQEIYESLRADGVRAFEKSYLELLETITAKGTMLAVQS